MRCRSRIRHRSQVGQGATEYLLIISVVMVALVAAAYVFVPQFRLGVQSLAVDVELMLQQGDMGPVGGMNRETGATTNFAGPPGSQGPQAPNGSGNQGMSIPGDVSLCNGHNNSSPNPC